MAWPAPTCWRMPLTKARRLERIFCLCPNWIKCLCAHQVPSPEAGRSARVTVAVVDTFVWQALASVAIPGFTINRVCAASLYVLGTATRWPLAVRKWTTTALGLLTIPIIIHPIDRSVDFLLDSSLRKLYPSVGKPSSS
ncbi:mitochondrial fission process protein 1 isoform X2 [Nomascus leucogenys]|uniref:mitochondrial fission process protein 1 isoform X2 n=1 Tax=Nomascus leucogenys TaxID=61853 RepID=UPI00062AAA27|nr:mitochondrial fission process protein 1 isoform X2 [Nomascus leucogenys]